MSQQIQDAYIVAATRTPIGKAPRGMFRHTRPDDLLVRAIGAGVGSLECRRDVHDEFNRQVDEQHGRMVWSHPGMETYYRNPAGRVVTNWPWRVVDYWERTRAADLDDFVLEPARNAVPANR